MPDSVCSIYKEGTTGTLTSVNSPGTATVIEKKYLPIVSEPIVKEEILVGM